MSNPPTSQELWALAGRLEYNAAELDKLLVNAGSVRRTIGEVVTLALAAETRERGYSHE